MRFTVTPFCKRLLLGICLGMLGLLTWGTTVWATTRMGNAEMQMWYRMRHTFHSNGGDSFDWIQWRNEVFFWLTYEDLIKNGSAFDRVQIPFVKGATFNARYRFRADPMYSIRNHYQNIYDDEERENWVFPENGFRDIFLDLDFGDVGWGGLSARVGNQQIVWGESDLYRSIDIINPLRIDQGQGAGEKFDEFRSPIWALKFLYSIGNVGSYFSNVSIEPFWSPRWRSGESDLILEGGYRIPEHVRGCLDQNNREVPYDPVTCANLRSANGERVFTHYRPKYRSPTQNYRHPWSIFSVGPNAQTSPDFVCQNQRCSPDIFGDRHSVLGNLEKGSFKHQLNGAFNKAQAGGVRIQGTSYWGVDWSLVYIYLPSGANGVNDINSHGNDPQSPTTNPIYGDPADVQRMFPGAPIRGTFEEGLRRCLSENGKNHADGLFKNGATTLVGVDVFGYNDPKRFRSNNPKGTLDADGNPIASNKHNAKRVARTDCVTGQHDYGDWTHVPGFTLTYNDFDYTGAIIRVEQSWSSKETIRKNPRKAAGTGGKYDPLLPYFRSDNFDAKTNVWRSMVGFDLLRSYPLLRYIPGMPRDFYNTPWFLSGQWLMQNHWNNVSNNFCSGPDETGTGYTEEQVAADRAQGIRSYSSAACRRYRWNHLFTLGLGNGNLMQSRIETRNAVVFEPRSHAWLLFSQWWWRNVLGYENFELSAGVAWNPSSTQSDSWSSLQFYADRDQVWFEATYYLL